MNRAPPQSVLRVLPPPPVVVVPAPPPPPGPYLPPPPPGMRQANFNSLIALLEATDFDSDRLQIVRTAASRNRFTVKQAGRVLDCLAFSADRLAAVTALKPSLVDPENGHLLARHFDFSSDKEKVAALFSHGRRAPSPPVSPRRPAGAPGGLSRVATGSPPWR